jgi:hypothetical protein
MKKRASTKTLITRKVEKLLAEILADVTKIRKKYGLRY